MKRILIWVLFISFSLLLLTTTSTDEEEVKQALINFLKKLSNNYGVSDPKWGWNTTSDPCKDHWQGIICDNQTLFVKRIILDSYNFSGTFNASSLCNVKSLAASLTVVSLSNNSLRREYLDDIVNCRQLTQFNISRNQFSGTLPDSLSRLDNLKGLDISQNNFSGSLPDLPRISGLTEFLAQNNQLSGAIPNFVFSNLLAFNVSFNNFSGAIPFGGAHFPSSSYIDNPQLCGPPLPKNCPPLPIEAKKPNDVGPGGGSSKNQILMYLGYFIFGLVVFIVIIFVVCKTKRTKKEKIEADNKVASVDDSINKPSFVSRDYKAATKKSRISAVSAESAPVSSSLVVLTSPEVNGLRFEELLKAPAELLGRGKHGSVYKIICEDQGTKLAVKRIKGCTISSNDFKQRMHRLNRVKHPNVLPAVAFYCSKQEKLLVYEYQQNGSLFRLLHGTQSRQAFEWSSRLGMAATIAETLAFMHEELHEDGIPHGNLKSSNIFLNKNMEPCISEYGLMVVNSNQDLSLVIPSTVNSYQSTEPSEATFKSDIYGFGVILLELLTGKISMVQNNGMDLATWVVSVVREEWTVEVFDKTLIQEGASEERMVNLLQVAIKCVNRSPDARPSIKQVALMINTIKEDEDRSMEVSLLI